MDKMGWAESKWPDEPLEVIDLPAGYSLRQFYSRVTPWYLFLAAKPVFTDSNGSVAFVVCGNNAPVLAFALAMREAVSNAEDMAYRGAADLP